MRIEIPNNFNFDNLPDDVVISLTKEELLEIMAVSTIAFIDDCKEAAKANWCESQVNDLVHLFDSVTKQIPYSELPEEE